MWVAVPQGTFSFFAQMTSFAPPREESRPFTPAGLPLGVMRTRVLEANFLCSPARPSFAAFSIVGSSAVARTSPEAPLDSWSTRSWEPAKV